MLRTLVLSEATTLPTARTGGPQALQVDVALDHMPAHEWVTRRGGACIRMASDVMQ